MTHCRSLIAALLGLCLAAAAALASPVGQVIRLSGTAELTRGGARAPLVLGAALEPGDRIVTAGSGRVRVQLIDGSTINLGAQAALVIGDVLSQGPGTERQIWLDLGAGALRALAAPATPSSRFEIRTPMAVTAVRGTEWGILASALRSDILILSGRVGIRRNVVSGESAVSLTQRMAITVDQTGLGRVGRWSEADFAALDAATAVPGPEIPFDPGRAAPINLVPIQTLPQPQPLPQQMPQQTQPNNCPDGSFYCRKGGRERNENRPDHGDGHDD